MIFTLLLICSCSSIKLKNGEPNLSKKNKILVTKFIAVNEKINHNGKKIGEFVLREDLKTDWIFLRNKIEEFAKSNGANIIEFKTIGFGKKGNGFYADGTIFYTENISNIEKELSEKCSIFIIRDNLESPLGSLFTIDIKIEETEFKNLKKNVVINKEFSDCNKDVNISINNKNQTVKLSGESKYFTVSKQSNGNAMGNGISIGIGGVSLQEIKNKELGKLIMYQSK